MFDMVPFIKNNNSIIRRGDYFDDLFNNFFQDDFLTNFNMMGNSFKVDLKEDENNYIIEADLPGFNKEAINLEYDNNYLIITAKRDDTFEDKKENLVRREKKYGEFRRSFYIDNVQNDNIAATFENGVLKITLPKNKEGFTNRRKIDIR